MSDFSLEGFTQKLSSENFQNKKTYASNKRFLGKLISHLEKSDLSSLSPEQKNTLFQTLNSSASSLRKLQDSIRENKLNHGESKLKKIGVYLYNRIFKVPRLTNLIKSINVLAEKQGLKSFRVQTHRTERWKNIAQKIKTLGKGSTKAGARILKKNYWIETVGISFQIDEKNYTGRIYMGFFQETQSSYLKAWKKQKNKYGVPFHELYSFEQYMNQEVIPKLSEEEKANLIRACSDIVEYYKPEELSSLEVSFQPGGILGTQNSNLNNWTQKINNGEADQTSFRSFLETMNPSQGIFTPVSPIGLPFIYVLTTDKKLHIQIKQRGKANHTSLSGGHAVLAAGELQVDQQGKLRSINCASGHYKPGNAEIITMLKFVQSQGVDIDTLNITYLDKKGNPDILTSQPPQKIISEWVEAECKKLPIEFTLPEPSISFLRTQFLTQARKNGLRGQRWSKERLKTIFENAQPNDKQVLLHDLLLALQDSSLTLDLKTFFGQQFLTFWNSLNEEIQRDFLFSAMQAGKRTYALLDSMITTGNVTIPQDENQDHPIVAAQAGETDSVQTRDSLQPEQDPPAWLKNLKEEMFEMFRTDIPAEDRKPYPVDRFEQWQLAFTLSSPDEKKAILKTLLAHLDRALDVDVYLLLYCNASKDIQEEINQSIKNSHNLVLQTRFAAGLEQWLIFNARFDQAALLQPARSQAAHESKVDKLQQFLTTNKQTIQNMYNWFGRQTIQEWWQRENSQ